SAAPTFVMVQPSRALMEQRLASSHRGRESPTTRRQLPSHDLPAPWTGPIHGEVFHGRPSLRLLHSVAYETGFILHGVRDATARICRPHRRRSRVAAGGAGAAAAVAGDWVVEFRGVAPNSDLHRGVPEGPERSRLCRRPQRDDRIPM